MKRVNYKNIVSSLAVCTLLLTGCGSQGAKVKEQDGGQNITEKVDALLKQKKTDQAESFVAPYLESEKKAEALCSLGDIYLAKGDSVVALYTYYKSIQADSLMEDAYVNASVLLNSRGESFESITMLREALKKLPESAKLMNALGCAYDVHGNEGDAMEMFKLSYAADDSFVVPIRNLGIKYLLNDELHEAEECFVQASMIEPNDTKLCNLLGLTYARKDSLELAISQFNRAIALDKNNVEAFYNLGYLYESHGDLFKAKLNYERAYKLGDEPAGLKLQQVKFKNIKKQN